MADTTGTSGSNGHPLEMPSGTHGNFIGETEVGSVIVGEATDLWKWSSDHVWPSSFTLKQDAGSSMRGTTNFSYPGGSLSEDGDAPTDPGDNQVLYEITDAGTQDVIGALLRDDKGGTAKTLTWYVQGAYVDKKGVLKIPADGAVFAEAESAPWGEDWWNMTQTTSG